MIYGMSSIVGRFLNYLLVPLYTYKIAAATGGYGVITNVYAYTALLLVMLTFGMETTFFYFANRERDRWHEVFSTAAWMVGLVAVAFVTLCFVFISPISSALGYENHPEYIRVMASVVALDAFQSIFFARLRFEGRAWKFASLKLFFIIFNIGLNLFAFLVLPTLGQPDGFWQSWSARVGQVGMVFLINLVCTSVVTLGFLPELRDMRRGIDRTLMLPMLRYTWPLLLLGIAGILNQVADKIVFRFIVPGAEGEVQLGIYGACVKIAMIMAIITQAFRYAYEPFVFGGSRDKNSSESQALVMKYFVVFTLAAFVVVVCYIDVFRYLVNADYWDGLRAVPIVMIAEIFMGVYFNLSFWYKLSGETYWGAIMSAIGCVVLLAVNIVFVPRYGYMACAWGGVAGYGVCMVMSYVLGQRKGPVPYPVKAIAGYFLLAMVLYGCTLLVQGLPVGWRIAVGTMLVVVYLAVVAYCERALVGQAVGRLVRRRG